MLHGTAIFAPTNTGSFQETKGDFGRAVLLEKILAFLEKIEFSAYLSDQAAEPCVRRISVRTDALNILADQRTQTRCFPLPQRRPCLRDDSFCVGPSSLTNTPYSRCHSYSVERESRVADENSPDIRFRAKGSDARVPMEIKVAETWSLADLEEALTEQLVGRYLRDQHNRWGILLLVHQKAKPRGWLNLKKGRLSIGDVLTHLRAMAARIAAARPDAPQPTVELVDVSAAFSKRKRRQSKRAKKASRPKSVRAPAAARIQASTAKPKAKRRTRARKPASRRGARLRSKRVSVS
jgi:hypothetical protein